MSDGHFTEVPKKQVHGHWVPMAEDDLVILGDLAEITDGQAVQVAPQKSAVLPASRR